MANGKNLAKFKADCNGMRGVQTGNECCVEWKKRFSEAYDQKLGSRS